MYGRLGVSQCERFCFTESLPYRNDCYYDCISEYGASCVVIYMLNTSVISPPNMGINLIKSLTFVPKMTSGSGQSFLDKEHRLSCTVMLQFYYIGRLLYTKSCYKCCQ